MVVKLGTGGKVTLYNGTGGTVDLIADVAGYYLAGTPTDAGRVHGVVAGADPGYPVRDGCGEGEGRQACHGASAGDR